MLHVGKLGSWAYLEELVDEAAALGAGAQQEDEVGVAQLGQALGLSFKGGRAHQSFRIQYLHHPVLHQQC